MIQSKFNILFLLFTLSILFSACNVENTTKESEWWKLKVGDNHEWAALDYDDSDWEMDGDIDEGQLYWVRLNIELKEDLKKHSLLVASIGSYEGYWDGTYIDKNGELKTNEKDEVPGTYFKYIIMPDSMLTKGKHVLALRSTKQFGKDGNHAYFMIDDTFKLLRKPLQMSQFMFILAGAFLLAIFYFFFSFASNPKEYSTLIFGVICTLILGLLIIEFVKHFYLYTYDFQRTCLELVGIINIALSILIPLYFMIQFAFPWKKILLSILVISLIVIESIYHTCYDQNALIHAGFIWGISILLSIYGIFKKVKGAVLTLIALLTGVFSLYFLLELNLNHISPFDYALFLGYIIIVLSMLYVLTLRRKEVRLAYEASLVHSERLKNELLKKNIKPHFIMNTLTSLIDWVEESPKEGVKFINELASEFEVLNEIADYKLIPIDQEIKLCKSHIKIMGYRKEIKYIWEEKGIDHNDIIPPAIIHTAVENGVTHSLPDKNGVIKFILSFEKEKGVKKYTLETIAGNRGVSAKGKLGTGLKYIQSRLQESYPDQWELISQATNTGWETIINIKL